MELASIQIRRALPDTPVESVIGLLGQPLGHDFVNDAFVIFPT